MAPLSEKVAKLDNALSALDQRNASVQYLLPYYCLTTLLPYYCLAACRRLSAGRDSFEGCYLFSLEQVLVWVPCAVQLYVCHRVCMP